MHAFKAVRLARIAWNVRMDRVGACASEKGGWGTCADACVTSCVERPPLPPHPLYAQHVMRVLAVRTAVGSVEHCGIVLWDGQ